MIDLKNLVDKELFYLNIMNKLSMLWKWWTKLSSTTGLLWLKKMILKTMKLISIQLLGRGWVDNTELSSVKMAIKI